MSSVSTEGKLEWFLGVEYALRTLGAYLRLGFSLGMVQARHACVPYKLALYEVICWWRRYIVHAPEDTYVLCEQESVAEKAISGCSGHTPNKVALSCAQANGIATPEIFLAKLLAKFDSLAAITHSEAVDVRLLNRLMRQDILFREQRNAQAAAGVAMPSSATGLSDENIVFHLAEMDVKYASALAAGHPVSVTYRDFIVLVTLLSEAIAWDLLWIHAEKERLRAHQNSKIVDAAVPVLLPSQPATTADCIALMLPNSVEYNAVWLATARASPLLSFLNILYGDCCSSAAPHAERAIYRSCRTALLNTNLASNAMLYHAIECSGSVMIVIDAAYVPLLFCDLKHDDAADDPNGTPRLTLNVPPSVRRVYLWRSSNATGKPIPSNMTAEMKELLRAFNAEAYGDAASVKETDAALGDDVPTPPPTPSLDLYDIVKPFVMRAQAVPAFTVDEVRYTYLISSSRARFLMHAMLSRPPPSWGSLLALKGLYLTKKSPVIPDAAAASFMKSRQQLQRYQEKMASTLAQVLRRFHHAQPILYIYTSGTTGLPKAARFSHLRFFATGFLSRLLSFRDKIAETVVQQMDEVEYVSAHPAAAAVLASKVSQHQDCYPPSASTPPLPTPGELDVTKRNIDEAGETSVPRTNHCRSVAPAIFGIDSVNSTRRKRNRIEAALFAIMNAWLWCLQFFATALGLKYVFVTAVEQRRYTSAQLVAIESERSLITVYNCLPMYHTVGSVFCLGHLFHALEEQQDAWAAMRRCAPRRMRLAARVPTARMVLRSKFSASQFRNDLQRYHVTVVQYIGEVLRYAVLYERNHPRIQATPHNAATKVGVASVTTECDSLAAQNRITWRVPYAFGNGLRQDIWVECMRRLNIAHPLEFYSSTEGNIFLFNLYGMPGIVGHIPRFPFPFEWLSLQYIPFFPFRVLQFDEESQEVYRDPKTGYCAHCAVGDVGEVVGEVVHGFDIFALRRFDGYHKSNSVAVDGGGTPTVDNTAARSIVRADGEEDWQARKKKEIRHVFWPYSNDCYFLSGDLVRMDRLGFCTFVDRIGDTFRWKGENVSTMEVSNALQSISTTSVRVQEAVVYGVQLPGREGRAGMAMLTLHLRSPSSSLRGPQSLTLSEERQFLQDDLYGFFTGEVRYNGDGTTNQAILPAYAIPLFLRIRDIETDEDDEDNHTARPLGTQPTNAPLFDDEARTTTFKHKKGVLARQGYEFDGSSTTSAQVPTGAWGGGGGATHAQETSTPYVRIYVLVSNLSVLKELRVPSTSDSGAIRSAGYIPLTVENRALLGASMDKCGW